MAVIKPAQSVIFNMYHCNIFAEIYDRPVVIGNPASLNVGFPFDWDKRQALRWRVMTGLFDADYLDREQKP